MEFDRAHNDKAYQQCTYQFASQHPWAKGFRRKKSGFSTAKIREIPIDRTARSDHIVGGMATSCIERGSLGSQYSRPQERIMNSEVYYHDGFFEVKTQGDAEPGGFGQFLDLLVAHEKWKPGTPFLANHSELNTKRLTANDVRSIAERHVKSRAHLGQARAAVLVAGDTEYGLARMWEIYVEGRWDVTTKIFRSRDEAISWLKGV